MFTINYENKKCTPTSFDKTIFHNLDNTIVHVFTDNTDYIATCMAICRHISEVIGEVVYPCGTYYYHQDRDRIEMKLFIRLH